MKPSVIQCFPHSSRAKYLGNVQIEYLTDYKATSLDLRRECAFNKSRKQKITYAFCVKIADERPKQNHINPYKKTFRQKRLLFENKFTNKCSSCRSSVVKKTCQLISNICKS